ncbi:MAG: hypothetical protein QX199_15840 [Methylococcaceae bacterium]
MKGALCLESGNVVEQFVLQTIANIQQRYDAEFLRVEGVEN